MIFKNSNQKGLKCFLECLTLPHSVNTIEFIAACATVQFTKDLCINKLECEGDSHMVISALKASNKLHAQAHYRRDQTLGKFHIIVYF